MNAGDRIRIIEARHEAIIASMRERHQAEKDRQIDRLIDQYRQVIAETGWLPDVIEMLRQGVTFVYIQPEWAGDGAEFEVNGECVGPVFGDQFWSLLDMESWGWVERPESEDRREIFTLTDAGRAVIADAMKARGTNSG